MSLPAGFISPADFARKVGVSYAHVINWTRTGKLPFKVADNGKYKMIPEFEAMQSPVVIAAMKKRGKEPPKESSIPPMRPPEPPSEEILKDERLFLIARQKAAGYIARARNCKLDRKHQAEAELLWMAVECFGFRP